MREIAAILFLLAFAIRRPELARRPISWCARTGRRVARHRTGSLVLVALISLTLQATLSLCVRWPLPCVHDEFAYLLQADTFASGRLTNPTHPLSDFFETYHVLQRPTYQAKYPPAQGLVLAWGQWLFGEPIVGVWLSAAAAAAAVCWMLQGWMPPRWALLGGFLAALHPHLATCWGQTFWGGFVAMTGGALVFGALPRLTRQPRVRDAVMLGCGLAVLANSRPYEGAVACLPAACVLLGWLLRNRRWACPAATRQVVLPLLAIALLTAAWMAFYNYRVTGTPWRMPYQVWWHSRTGDVTMRYILFGSPGDVPVLQGKQPEWWDRLFGLRQISMLTKGIYQGLFYLTAGLISAILLAPWTLRCRVTRIAGTTLLLVLAAVLLEGTAGHPHYVSPAAGLFFAVAVQGFRRLRLWRWQTKPSGQAFVAGLLAIYFLSSLHTFAVQWKTPAYGLHNWCLARAQIEAHLENDSQNHLVIVRYGPNHSKHIEWVQNRADIDRLRVVWAHERMPLEMDTLRHYFSDRRIWLVEADAVPPRLTPYPVRSANSSPRVGPSEYGSSGVSAVAVADNNDKSGQSDSNDREK